MSVRRNAPLLVAALVCVTLLAARAGAAPQPPKVVHEPPSNETVLVRLPDDSIRLLYVVQPARDEIRSIESRDHGKTWGNDRPEVKLPGKAYYALQVLLDRDQELQLAFHILGEGTKGYCGRHYNLWHARTTGGRKAWTEPKQFFEGYVGSMRGFTQMTSGRLLLAAAIAVPEREPAPKDDSKPDFGWNDNVVFYSDDAGATWTLGPARLKVAMDPARGRTRYGGVEPNLVQLTDGRMWMLIRTKNGQFYESFSPDGVGWSEAKPSRLISSDSPAATLRLRDGRLVLFLNACQQWDDPRSYAIGGRDVLHAAVSDDDGKTWRGFREVLRDPKGAGKGDRGTAYPWAVEAADGNVILVSGQGEGRRAIVTFSPEWLLETRSSDEFADGGAHWTMYEQTGAAIVDHPDRRGAKVLAVRKPGGSKHAAAVWNFPAGQGGKVSLRVKLAEEGKGAGLSLTDHYNVAADTQADENAVYSVVVDAATNGVKAGEWVDLAIEWSPDGSAVLKAGGQEVRPLKAQRQTSLGINYLRLHSPADEADPAGFLVDRVAVEVQHATGAGAATTRPVAVASNDGRTIRVVALGDSITKGARPARGTAPAVNEGVIFTARLQSMLRDAGLDVEILNAGTGGNKTDQGVARLDADVLARKPDVVLVMYGANDQVYEAGKDGPRVAVPQFESNLRAIVNRVRAAGARPILMTTPPFGTAWKGSEHPIYLKAEGGRDNNAALRDYIVATRRVAESMDVPLVDHFTYWSQQPQAQIDAWQPDGVHPDGEGHRVLAEQILPVLKREAEAAAAERQVEAGASLRLEKVNGPATGGALMELGADGAFDAAWATAPSVLFDGTTYRMWYSSFYSHAEGVGGIGLATSTDGVHWKQENGGKPVLTPGPDGAFDAGQVMGPCVLFDGQTYRMWYTGDPGRTHEASKIVYYQIGLATSADGVHWTRANGGEPVLAVGAAGSPDEVQAATPCVLREPDGTFRMWYAAWAPTTNHTICAARSPDGVRWTRENAGQPVTGLSPSIAYGQSVARTGDGLYLMLYMALGASRGLYAATSPDGLRWEMLNGGDPALMPSGSPAAFDRDIVGHPYLLTAGDHLRVYYTGYQLERGGPSNWRLRIGVAEGGIR